MVVVDYVIFMLERKKERKKIRKVLNFCYSSKFILGFVLVKKVMNYYCCKVMKGCFGYVLMKFILSYEMEWICCVCC